MFLLNRFRATLPVIFPHKIAYPSIFLCAVAMAFGTLFLPRVIQAEEKVWTSDFRVGGCGGVYFLAEPGTFWVEVEKQDLNQRGRKTHVRAILIGPDRTVVSDVYLPFQGQEKGSGPAPVQRHRFEIEVPVKGVYGLNITASEDRYGQDMVWGMRTNCPRYLVETSRGHKDERHQEPIVLQQGDTPGAVCFLPRTEAFDMEVTGVRGETLRLLDSTGTELATLPVDDEGTATYTAGADLSRAHLPWQLHLSGANGTVNIDGLTRWGTEDGGNLDLSLWTPRAETWFPFHENRWLLTPYKQRVWTTPGDPLQIEFEIHNNGRAEKVVELSLLGPDGKPGLGTLSETRVTLPPSQVVPVTYTNASASESGGSVHVRASTGSEFSTYSTVEWGARQTGENKTLDLPIALRPYEHENAQFAYAPDYPRSREFYFDTENQPVSNGRTGVNFLHDGTWQATELGMAVVSKVAFDEEKGVYTIGMKDGKSYLHYSDDGGATFDSYPIPGTGYVDVEQFSGHNAPSGPPPFVRFHRTAVDPDLIWRRVHDLDLFVPSKTADGKITIGEPIRLTEECIGLSSHSGIPSTIVSRGDKVHVVWAEATEPEEKVPGVPTYVATYDRTTQTLSTPALVGYGPPANDVHNTPSITMDSQGYLHVLVGTHGRAFLYAKSLAPNDASGGWTEPVPLGTDLRQTYVGFVCGADDTLHVVFRLWHTDTTYFPASHYASLSYMQKKPGEPWSAPRPLVVPPFSEYSVYYHRLTIDRRGDLYLSYEYWSTYFFYRIDRRETRRALMTSATAGETWSLVEKGDWIR